MSVSQSQPVSKKKKKKYIYIYILKIRTGRQLGDSAIQRESVWEQRDLGGKAQYLLGICWSKPNCSPKE
jgi:hypothetical protein